MDTAVNQLNVLLRQGVISVQTYVDGLDAIALRRECPTPAPRRQPPTPAPRRQSSTQRIAEIQAPAVVQSILDTPIPEAYRPIPPPRKPRERKRKAIIEEFNPAVKKPKTIQKDILDHPLEQEGLVFRRTQWAIGDFLRGWQMDVPQGHPLGADPLTFLEVVRPQIRQKLTEEILAIKGVKFQLALKIQFRKDRPDGGEEYTDPVIRHKQETLLQAVGTAEINEVLDKAFPHILETLEKWTQRGSGWVVDHVSTLWLDIARYQPLRGVSYIPLPAAVRNKKAVVNVKNTDDQCLRRALRSAMFPVDTNPQRPPSIRKMMASSSQESTPPHPSRRFPRLKSRTASRSTSLGGTKV